jgi:Na+/pantothenate symporter
VGIAAAGGWTSVLDVVRAQDPLLLEPMGTFGFTPAGDRERAGFLAVGVAFLGAPQLLTRFMAARDTRRSHTGA